MAPQIVSPEKRYWMSLLLDTYGELLTEKQRTFMRRYYEQDFSFGEIAREYDVSRQAIFDSVKHGEDRLNRYERVLALVDARTREGLDSEASGPISGANYDLEVARDVARRTVDRLEMLSKADAAGEDSPAPSTRRELSSIASDLRSILEEKVPAVSNVPAAPAPARPSFFRDNGPEVD